MDKVGDFLLFQILDHLREVDFCATQSTIKIDCELIALDLEVLTNFRVETDCEFWIRVDEQSVHQVVKKKMTKRKRTRAGCLCRLLYNRVGTSDVRPAASQGDALLVNNYLTKWWL